MNTTVFQYQPGMHKGLEVIFIKFPRNAEYIQQVKQLTGVRFTRTHSCWYVTDNHAYRTQFNLPSKSIVGKAVLDKISLVNQPALQAMQSKMIRNGLSPSTIKTYTLEFAQLLYIIKDVNVNLLSRQKVEDYFLYCYKQLKLSENSMHSRINAVKYYFEQVLKQPKILFQLDRPK
jgi:integrase/recombinase XerD